MVSAARARFENEDVEESAGNSDRSVYSNTSSPPPPSSSSLLAATRSPALLESSPDSSPLAAVRKSDSKTTHTKETDTEQLSFLSDVLPRYEVELCWGATMFLRPDDVRFTAAAVHPSVRKRFPVHVKDQNLIYQEGNAFVKPGDDEDAEEGIEDEEEMHDIEEEEGDFELASSSSSEDDNERNKAAAEVEESESDDEYDSAASDI